MKMKYILIAISILLPALMFSQDDIYKRVEEMPRFPGCEDVQGTVDEKTLHERRKLKVLLLFNLSLIILVS